MVVVMVEVALVVLYYSSRGPSTYLMVVTCAVLKFNGWSKLDAP